MRSKQTLAWMALLALALVFPFVMRALGLDFYTSVLSRMLIYGLAAVSLNLILGYGGLVSFGHAAFMGIGAYTVGILITEGIVNGFVGFAAAMLMSAIDRSPKSQPASGKRASR